MSTCLIVSLLFHVGILIVAQSFFPITSINKPLTTCHVELFHPPLDPLNDDNSTGTEVDKDKSTGKTSPKETEETISLDTKDN